MSPETEYTDRSPLGESSSPIEILIKGNSSLSFNRHGGMIDKLELDGKTILYKPKRSDGKQAATHPCTPNFGPVDNKYGLERHGPGRKLMWKKVKTDEKGALKTRLEIDGKKYPEFEGLVVEQTFKLVEGKLTIETTHTNNGDEEMPVNFGEHFYLNSLYSGWKELKINGESMADEVRNTGVIVLEETNEISGLPFGDIILKQEGLSKAVLWTDRNKDKTIFDNHYVCIEPVEGNPVKGNDPGFFGTKESMIEPGKDRTTVIKLSLKD